MRHPHFTREVTIVGAAGQWVSGEVYAGGHHLATYENNTTTFDHSDWLGTERYHTTVTGTFEESCQSLPFGDGFNCTGTETTPLHFTGKEHDFETNLEDFGARYYNSTYARFVTPDWSEKPVPVPYANLTDPQSLNQYVIVKDNPNTFADLDGHLWSLTQAEEFGVVSSSAAASNGTALASSTSGQPSPPPNQTPAAPSTPAQAQQQVTASVQGKTVTYTYADGTQVTRSGTHPFRDNNPGDLTGGHGSIGRDAGFAIYGTPDAGWSALQATLTGKYADSTIAQTMNAFNPAGNGKDPMLKGNDPVKYAATLAGAIGVPVSTQISALTPAQLSTVMANIGRAEGYYAHGNSVSQINPNQ